MKEQDGRPSRMEPLEITPGAGLDDAMQKRSVQRLPGMEPVIGQLAEESCLHLLRLVKTDPRSWLPQSDDDSPDTHRTDRKQDGEQDLHQ